MLSRRSFIGLLMLALLGLALLGLALLGRHANTPNESSVGFGRLALSAAYSGGSAIFVSLGPEGLQVVDIRSRPRPAGFLPVRVGKDPNLPWGRVISIAPWWGNTALISADWLGVLVVVADDPDAPYWAGAYDSPGVAVQAVAVGPLVYVADMDGGLRIADISEPRSPRELGYLYPTPYSEVLGVGVAGRTAALATDRGLFFVDVSDPSAPTQNAFLSRLRRALLAAEGNYLYVAGEEGLFVLEVSDPSRPVVMGQLPGIRDVRAITVRGGMVFLGARDGLHIVDARAPAIPKEIRFRKTDDPVYGVAVVGESVAYTTGNSLVVTQLKGE